ncbi:MAG: NAD(P)-dependent oxidoreductase [Actinobacteria bacterium]|nr:NAD(P)-dependent oxidoreductase [Actinomycetota bacterium]
MVRRLVRSAAVLWDGSPVERVVAVLRPGGSSERLEVLTPDDHWSIERADVYDVGDLRGLLRRVRPRAVVNTALDPRVYTGEPIGHAPLETLFSGLAEFDDARLVHAGSAWVLASGERLDESADVDPRSPYALHKAQEDAFLPVLGERSAVSWISLRLFNIFGPYEKPSRLLPYLVSRLSRGEPAEISHGDQIRDFNDVDDIAEAFVLALAAQESAWAGLYHIGSGRATTVRDFALTVAEVAGDPDQVVLGAGQTPDQELASLVAEPSKARRMLGWQPENRLDERVRAATRWWLERLSQRAEDRPRQEESLR